MYERVGEVQYNCIKERCKICKVFMASVPAEIFLGAKAPLEPASSEGL